MTRNKNIVVEDSGSGDPGRRERVPILISAGFTTLTGKDAALICQPHPSKNVHAVEDTEL